MNGKILHAGFNTEEEHRAYDAGFECGLRGATDSNCHFQHFGSPEQTQAWTEGVENGKAERQLAKELVPWRLHSRTGFNCCGWHL